MIRYGIFLWVIILTISAARAGPLHDAARAGDADRVRELISAGLPVDSRSHDGNTPLHVAASSGFTEIVGILIAHGAEVEATNQFGETPATMAAVWGHRNVLDLLQRTRIRKNSIAAPPAIPTPGNLPQHARQMPTIARSSSVPAERPSLKEPPPQPRAAPRYEIQLGAFRSGRAPAENLRRGLVEKHADLFAGIETFVRDGISNNFQIHRVRAGPLDERRARHICAQLKTRGAACVLALPDNAVAVTATHGATTSSSPLPATGAAVAGPGPGRGAKGKEDRDKGLDDAFAAYHSQDHGRAIRAFELLAQDGDPTAQNFLGVMHALGHGVDRDLAAAAFWYRQAAEQGSAIAQYNLGGLYENGQGVPADPSVAAQWFQRAANVGLPQAEHALATLYYLGQGVGQDYRAAARLYRRAAEQGHVESQHNLGVLYLKGHGVAQDTVRANKWWHIAAALADDLSAVRNRATRNIAKSAPLLSAAQRDSAQSQARTWLATHKSAPSDGDRNPPNG